MSFAAPWVISVTYRTLLSANNKTYTASANNITLVLVLRILMFLGLSDPYLFVRGTDPDLDVIKAIQI